MKNEVIELECRLSRHLSFFSFEDFLILHSSNEISSQICFSFRYFSYLDILILLFEDHSTFASLQCNLFTFLNLSAFSCFNFLSLEFINLSHFFIIWFLQYLLLVSNFKDCSHGPISDFQYFNIIALKVSGAQIRKYYEFIWIYLQ